MKTDSCRNVAAGKIVTRGAGADDSLAALDGNQQHIAAAKVDIFAL